VLDAHELTFPFERAARFQDMETGDEVMALPGDVRQHYLSRMTDFIEHYQRELRVAGIDYTLLDTSRPLDFALMSYLATRGRLY